MATNWYDNVMAGSIAPSYPGMAPQQTYQRLKESAKFNAKEDAKFTRHQRPTSNNSGEFFYRSNANGPDGHPDTNEYTRNLQDVTTESMMGSAATVRRQAVYTQGKRANGTSRNGDRQPEQAKRAKFGGSAGDKPSAGVGSNTRNKNNRSTILTGSRGSLGNSATSSKTLLGG